MAAPILIVIAGTSPPPSSFPDAQFILISLSQDPSAIHPWIFALNQAGRSFRIFDFLALYNQERDRVSQEYSRWVDRFSLQKIEGKTIREKLAIGKTTLWWATRLAEKNHLKSPQILSALQLMVLEDHLKESSYSGVFFCTEDGALGATLEQLFLSYQLPILWQASPSFKPVPRFRLFAGILHRLGVYGYRKFLTAVFLNSHPSLPSSSLSMFLPFPNIDFDLAKKGIFHSRYLEAVQPLVSQHCDTYFLRYSAPAHYSFLTAIRDVRLFTRFNPGKVFILIESYLTIRVFWTRFLYGIRQLLCSSSLLKVTLFAVPTRRVNFYALFHVQWASDISGSGFMNNCLFVDLLAPLFRSIQDKKLFYLFEMQGFETLLNACAKEGHVSTYGFTHVFSSEYLRDYYLPAPSSPDECFSYPTPYSLGVNMPGRFLSFQNSVFGLSKLMPIEAQRFTHLVRPKSSHPVSSEPTLLVSTSISKVETDRQLALLRLVSSQISFRKILLKLHPNLPSMNLAPFLEGLDIEITSLPISTLFTQCDALYTTQSSAVALESLTYGLPTAVLSNGWVPLPSEVASHPLLTVIYTEANFPSFFSKLSVSDPHSGSELLYFTPDFSYWKAFLLDTP